MMTPTPLSMLSKDITPTKVWFLGMLGTPDEVKVRGERNGRVGQKPSVNGVD